jgi:RimJ/RimL family protein N-acetyltransferase
MRYFGHWPALGFGFWAVVQKQTDHYLGEIGMADFHRGIAQVPDGSPEFGWVLGPSAHGKGYATEAMTAIVAWADRNLAASASYCLIDPQNQPSLKLANKMGFSQIAEVSYHTMPSVVFRRDRK